MAERLNSSQSLTGGSGASRDRTHELRTFCDLYASFHSSDFVNFALPSRQVQPSRRRTQDESEDNAAHTFTSISRSVWSSPERPRRLPRETCKYRVVKSISGQLRGGANNLQLRSELKKFGELSYVRVIHNLAGVCCGFGSFVCKPQRRYQSLRGQGLYSRWWMEHTNQFANIRPAHQTITQVLRKIAVSLT